ncbi:serpin 1-like protein [Leptotrombidium deliense]|uniref:Serpin 1-like protein n=1 Tax=Leptotrombidium deliense TaxID=299467 RepID=A0A443SMX6_9ACAR|nr:serpin 1-like protein [Leptotrombidium deliense]
MFQLLILFSSIAFCCCDECSSLAAVSEASLKYGLNELKLEVNKKTTNPIINSIGTLAGLACILTAFTENDAYKIMKALNLDQTFTNATQFYDDFQQINISRFHEVYNFLLISSEYPVLEQFITKMKECKYLQVSVNIDFKTKLHILNSGLKAYVKNVTANTTDNCFYETLQLTTNEKLVFLSVNNFQENFHNKFKSNSLKQLFRNDAVNQLRVVSLYNRDQHPYFKQDDECQIIELRIGRYKMIIMLPHSPDGYINLVNKLNATQLRSISNRLKKLRESKAMQLVTILLPKFKIASNRKITINSTTGLGVLQNTFQTIPGMSTANNLQFSYVSENSAMKISDSEGAKFGQSVNNRHVLTVINMFKVDHPFLIFLFETVTGTDILIYCAAFDAIMKEHQI